MSRVGVNASDSCPLTLTCAKSGRHEHLFMAGVWCALTALFR